MRKSKNLYNVGIYTVRQHYFEAAKAGSDDKYLNYYATYKSLTQSNNADFYALPCVISQQVLMQVDRSFKSFFKLLKKKQTGKYNKSVNLPKYLDKDGYNCITITEDKLGVQFKKDGTLTIPNTKPNKV